MNNSILTNIGKKIRLDWKLVVFAVVIGIGIFLRVHNFSDWMLFKGDSFRDAVLVSRVYDQGQGELPLLGPRAGGSLLRLGPVFYYFQYIGAVLFGGPSPAALAFPTLLFSLLSLPVFYLLTRKYFDRDYALLLTGAFSLSFLAIEYSRFAWNPNATPFFNLLFLYAVLEFFDTDNSTRGNWWAGIAGLALAVSSQLHFANFLGLPLLLFLFLLFNWRQAREKLDWTKVAIFGGVIFLLYLPVIVSDVLKSGDNLRQFLHSVTGKASEKSLVSNISEAALAFGKYFARIAVGYIGVEEMILKISEFLILLSVLANGILWGVEEDAKKKRFLLLTFLLMLVYALLFLPLAEEVDRPRFFLPLIMLPFIFAGFWGQLFGAGRGRKIGLVITISLCVFSAGSNLREASAWLGELKRAQTEVVTQDNARILDAKKGDTWWTWQHFLKTAEFLDADCPHGNIYFTVSGDTPDYDHSFEYALKNLGREKPGVRIFDKKVPFDPRGCYYFLSQSSDVLPKRLENFVLRSPAVDLGNIKVLRFDFAANNLPEISPANSEAAEEKDEEEEEIKLDGHARLYWKDVARGFQQRFGGRK